MSNFIKNKIKKDFNTDVSRNKLLQISKEKFKLLIERCLTHESDNIDHFLKEQYEINIEMFISSFSEFSREWFAFWYEYLMNSNTNYYHYLNEIEIICKYSLWSVVHTENPTHTYGLQEIFHEIEILPFEETQMIENVNDVYDLFFRYRNAKNTKDKIDNLKPIIDLVIGDVKSDNASFFIGVYKENDLDIIRKKMHAIRHANDNTEPWDDYSKFIKNCANSSQINNFIDHVYFLTIECFAFIRKQKGEM